MRVNGDLYRVFIVSQFNEYDGGVRILSLKILNLHGNGSACLFSLLVVFVIVVVCQKVPSIELFSA